MKKLFILFAIMLSGCQSQCVCKEEIEGIRGVQTHLIRFSAETRRMSQDMYLELREESKTLEVFLEDVAEQSLLNNKQVDKIFEHLAKEKK